MRVLATYDMWMSIDKAVWMYGGGDTDIEWLPTRKSRIQWGSFITYLELLRNVDGAVTNSVNCNICGAR